MRIYIAGSIFNDPNYMEKFAIVEYVLKSLGYQVFNPARIAAEQGLSIADPWEICFAAVIEYLYIADAICLLPDWETSSGAILERITAIQREKPILIFTELMKSREKLFITSQKFRKLRPKIVKLRRSFPKFTGKIKISGEE